MERTQVLIVGAGAAGLGVALALQRLGLDLRIVERNVIGSSFRRWPGETRFITPSFTANAFGLTDLNALTPKTSPAYSLGQEHPSGVAYARYLRALARHYELAVAERTSVEHVRTFSEGFRVETTRGSFEARFLIWATGEFQFPRQDLQGARLALPYARVKSWAALEGEAYTVIGGYESGLDAAYHLVRLGKRVQILDPNAPWKRSTGEPSQDVSPYTLERLREALETGRLELLRLKATRITRANGQFQVYHANGVLQSPTPPILATGFEGGFEPVQRLFEWKGSAPLLHEASDESIRTPGLFLVGPKVQHRDTAFCFIYKFRARFPVVAEAIGRRLGVDTAPLEVYRKRGMWADDLADCCTSRCAC
ncbi:NAD(P)/FAD-dependent oxidoreductase [Meiothermus sp.]|uniref:NAD(P)/FAD-dependent oxidoreductase n=1 Tax=Meiothermus sp. TaxID=1955249 RepID=UPI0021DB939D|nr:NAD(P)/FAD-dependent oxidoreductase [Meiothermus sp.]GIW34967.1 MAG: monooxygenase [Meiothermus sp.]